MLKTRNPLYLEDHLKTVAIVECLTDATALRMEKHVFNCGRMNHFAHRCRAPSRGRKNRVSAVHETAEPEQDPYYIGSIVEKNKPQARMAVIKLQIYAPTPETEVQFQIDTGSQCDILPARIYKQVTGDTLLQRIKPCKKEIVSYTGEHRKSPVKSTSPSGLEDIENAEPLHEEGRTESQLFHETAEPEQDPYYIGSIVEKNKPQARMAVIKLQIYAPTPETEVQFQIDTGSQCDILPARIYKQVTGDTLLQRIKPCKKEIVSYTGEHRKVTGKVNLPIWSGGHRKVT
ncbi:hypothetical protein OS493_034890 [Desmophyllum pertusum]|uniref:Uncharacterized protein n=1 Tax=Desmophyllum pertusum TaxID=174260 RepID=A0A9X0D1P3_9CNID|nr:hypothetical protein OS493_034890 [Desmophyllum pertusum]